MEPEVNIYCKKENKKKDCTCLYIITAIISLVLFFFIGALVQSLTSFVATLGTGAIIVLLITLALLLLSFLILLICCKKNEKKKKCNCC